MIPVVRPADAGPFDAQFTPEEARELTDKIRWRIAEATPLIAKAYQGRIWLALGYEGWHEYVVGEFGGALRLGRDERQTAVLNLRQEGLSTRAIGDALGVDNATVHRDLATVANATDLPETITGLDGKVRPAMGVHYSSETPEWYTPTEVVERVAQALGTIDLDPCADPDKGIPAQEHFTEADDGLSKPWYGRVYMNPPYGDAIKSWMQKLASEIEAGNTAEAIALVPARTDTAWWRESPHRFVCFWTGRLRFSNAETGAPFPSAVLYYGDRPHEFVLAFGGVGDLYGRIEAPIYP